MKVYRFAVHPEEDNYYFVERLNDASLYTQARNMDEVVMMARDVVVAMYEFDPKEVLIELVIPPDIQTKYDRKPVKRKPQTRKVAAATR